MKVLKITVLLFIICSCSSVKQIGKVNMISTRNVDQSIKYQVLTTYSGGSKRELKKTRSKSIEDAIDATVKKVPGGEFLMNCKIYTVNSIYVAVEGDVWGNPINQSFRGFRVGDKVTWKKKDIINGTRFFSGVISGLKDDKTCFIKTIDAKEETIEMSYDEITKVEK
jgi:hypothetical protein